MIEALAIAIPLGLIPAFIGKSKGYSFLGWWVFGALLLIVALPWALLMGDNPETRRPCPACRSTVPRDATACAHCGRDLPEPPPLAQNERPYERPPTPDPIDVSGRQLAAGGVLFLVAVAGMTVAFIR